MNLKDRNFIFLILLFALVGIVSWSFYFKTYFQSDTVDINVFPATIDGWTSEELTITEDEFRILETRNAFVRQYTGPDGGKVILFIVYSQSNRKVAHPPEICYAGGGVSILDSAHDTVPVDSSGSSILVNKLRLESGTEKQLSYYWFKVGDSYTSNYWKQQTLIALKTLLGKPAGSALVRISTDVGSEGEVAAVERIKKFSQVVVPMLGQYLP